MGLCILCSAMAGHGADDEASARYSVQNLAPPAFASGSSNSGDITVTPGTASLSLTAFAPIVVSTGAASLST